MTEPLHIKYRPQSFEEFVGGEAIKKSILKNLGTTHTYLFHGPRGCGKTTLARLVARELKVDNFEIHEMDAGSSGGVDDIRDLKNKLHMRPMAGDRKMYIIDECHLLSKSAMGSSLKILEEPPDYVFFALCTTEPKKVLSTIHSRSKVGQFKLKAFSRREMHRLLSWVCTEEGIDVDPAIYNSIMDAGEGIPRDTIGLLDKVRGMDKRDALDLIESGAENKTVIDLCRLLLRKDKSKWGKAKEVLNNMEGEPETVRQGVLTYMNKVTLGDGDPYLPICIMEEFQQDYFSCGKSGLLVSVYRSCLIK